MEFHIKAAPPYELVTRKPNHMWTYRGRPTIFGNPNCNDNGFCATNRVVQYVGETDEWIFLSNMDRARTGHEVVEVPREFCDFGPPGTAALIVGGYQNGQEGGPSHAKAELFGCPDTDGQSIQLPDFPKDIYLAGGNYVNNGSSDSVLICGGFQGDPGTAPRTANECFTWDTDAADWAPATSDLRRDRVALFMGDVNDYDDGDEYARRPFVIGNGADTEAYDAVADEWYRYRDLPFSTVSTLGCVAQEGDKIYTLGSNALEIDISGDTFMTTRAEAVPTNLQRTAACAKLEIDGELGERLIYQFVLPAFYFSTVAA